MCFKSDKKSCNEQGGKTALCGGGFGSHKEQDIRNGEEAQKEQSDAMKDQSASDNQPTKPAPTSEAIVATSINGIKLLIDNLIKKKRTIIVGYVFLMLLFVVVAALMARALIKLHEMLILSEIPYVILLFAIFFVYSAVMIYLVHSMLMCTRRYQAAINRLVILLTRLDLEANEQSKEELVDNELKMISRIIGEKCKGMLG
jgi:hypothetical protein